MPLHSLTSLRFIAAIAVVLSHLKYLLQSESPALRDISSRIFGEGYIGVTFFFILSGFILSHSYSKKMNEDRLSTLEFMWARVARIYPLHFCALILSVPLIFMSTEPIWPSFLVANFTANATLLQAFIPDLRWYFGFNAPSWSLSVEMFLYAAFPLLILLRARHLSVILFLLLALKLIFLLQQKGDMHFLQYIFPPLRLSDFVVGILAHRIWRHFKEIPNNTATLIQIASVVILGAFIVGSPMVSQAARFDLYYVLPMVTLIFAFSFQQGYLARAISGKTWMLLGEASFSLYMVHNLIIQYGEAARQALFKSSTAAFDITISVFYVSISIILSILVFRYFEMPVKSFVLNFIRFKPRVTRGPT